MMTNEINNIKSAISKVLSEKHPDFPEEVVYKVLDIQSDNLDDNARAAKLITDYLESYLNEQIDAPNK